MNPDNTMAGRACCPAHRHNRRGPDPNKSIFAKRTDDTFEEAKTVLFIERENNKILVIHF